MTEKKLVRNSDGQLAFSFMQAECKTCDGTGELRFFVGPYNCPDCKGTGLEYKEE
jgi:DnaJ-class molecular chaperone